jgi:hypothetical protein
VPEPAPQPDQAVAIEGQRRLLRTPAVSDSLYSVEGEQGLADPKGDPSNRSEAAEVQHHVSQTMVAADSAVEGDRPFIDAENPFEDYQLDESCAPFGNGQEPDDGVFPKQVFDDLEKNHIVVLYGCEKRAKNLARTVARIHFQPPWVPKVFYPKTKTNREREQDVMSIEQLITSRWLFYDARPKLLVVWDLLDPNLTPLAPHDYVDSRGIELLRNLREHPNLRVLVITRRDTWLRLTVAPGGDAMSAVGQPVEPFVSEPTRSETPLPSGIIDEINSLFGKPGLVTVWCIAWFSTASLDDLAFLIGRMLRHSKKKAEDREELIEKWRTSWPAILEKLGARLVEQSQAVVVEFSNEASLVNLRRALRVQFRIHHLELLSLLRSSEALLRATPELLQVFALFMARMTKEEGHRGRLVLVNLIEDWLRNAPDERTLYIVTAVFCSLVRDGETSLGSDALAQLPGNGYAEVAAAILIRSPSKFATQPWYFVLLNRILPALSGDIRLELLSRVIRTSAGTTKVLADSMTLARDHLSKSLYVEFVARFVEETLLGDRTRASCMLEVLHEATQGQNLPGTSVFESIRSNEFRVYAAKRADRWSFHGTKNELFDTWLIKTLAPVVPSVSSGNLIHLFGQALSSGGEIPLTNHLASPTSPVDQIVAMLLVDYAGGAKSRGWGASLADVIGLAIGSSEQGVAVYETLRTLAERFLRISRVLAFLSPTETTLELAALSAIRQFFDDKSEVVDRLQTSVEAKYFVGSSI